MKSYTGVRRLTLADPAPVLLFLVAIAVYTPGTSFGLPSATEPGWGTHSWLADELGSDAPILHLHTELRRRRPGNPQYPMFHYLVLGAAYAPYLAWHRLAGGIDNLSISYPYGFEDPVRGIQALALLARYVSVLMAAGTVVVAFLIGRTLWDRRAGVVSGVFVLLMYPMSFFARTSNVDVPALFWAALALWMFSVIVARGMSTYRLAALGCLTALAVATKDQNYAVLVPLAVPTLILWFRTTRSGASAVLAEGVEPPEGTQRGRARPAASARRRWSALVGATALTAFVYGVTSSLLLNPEGFFSHVAYITGQGGGYYRYSASALGYGALLLDTLVRIGQTLSWPIFAAALAGIALSARAKEGALWLLLTFPGLFLLALVPIRVVQLRFVIAVSFVLACFAAYAVTRLMGSARWRVMGLAVTGLLVLLAAPRPLELARLMVTGGSRAQASAWLASTAEPGDRVEHFGWERRVSFFPRVPPEVGWVLSESDPEPGGVGPGAEFVLLQGAMDIEPESLPPSDSPNQQPDGCPPWLRLGLADGSLGYELGYRSDVKTRFSHPDFGVSPMIEIYVWRDRATS